MPSSLTPAQRLRRLSDIPNQEGYRFIGVLKGGRHIECVVLRDPGTGLHSVERFADLIGWLPKI